MLSFWNREAIEIEVVNMLEDYLGRVMYPLDIDALAAEMGGVLHALSRSENIRRLSGNERVDRRVHFAHA